MQHTLRDLLKFKPCDKSIEQLLKRDCSQRWYEKLLMRSKYTKAELDMELTVDNIRHCSTNDILWALARLGYLDMVVEIARYAVKLIPKGGNDQIAANYAVSAAAYAWTSDNATDAAVTVRYASISAIEASLAIGAVMGAVEYGMTLSLIEIRVHKKLMELITEHTIDSK